MAMWQPDGGARTRIGVLTPHADVWPEAEFCAMAPDGISIHAARVHFGAYRLGERWTRPSPTILSARLPIRPWSMTPPDCSHQLRCTPSPKALPAATTLAGRPADADS